MKMFFSTYLPILLAEQGRSRDLLRPARSVRDQGDMGDLIFWLPVIIGIATVIFILWHVINRRLRHLHNASQLGLFLCLCKAHKLRWKDRWLLWRLARLKRLTDPGRVFLEPEWFKTPQLPAALRSKAAELKSIANCIFSGMDQCAKLGEDQQSPSAQTNRSKGADLPVLKTAPALDVAPWPASAIIAPIMPHGTDSPDNAAV
jgi:hypothetical protein